MANAVTTFLDDRGAAGHGERSAIVTPSASVTYRELLALACRVGNALRGLGVEAEQRVALLLPDGIEWAAVFFGVLRLGGVAVPLNTRLAPADWVTMLADSRTKVLVADAELARPLLASRADLPRLAHVVTTGILPGCRALGALMDAASPALEPEPMSADDIACWLYTSGTTAAPRAAVHLHRDLLACRHYGVEVLEASAGDRVFATSKLFFAYALGNALLMPCFVGGQTVLHPAWADPALVGDVMTRFRPTLFFSVPTFYARLLGSDVGPDTFASVRCAVSAGERLPEDLGAGFRARFGVEILDGMGATETIFMVLSNRPGRSRPGSSGTPVPGTAARLLDESGYEVSDGADGVLHVRTPSASPRYWNRLEQSRRAFVGEWFRTGDVYARDAEGFYYHRGREDDRFKVAGMWVAPADVEAALRAHPGVVDVGVVGAEDERGLVKAVAFVVPETGAQGPQLEAALADVAEAKLAPHQRPRRIVLVAELPRTATGKLQRCVLRERATPPSEG